MPPTASSGNARLEKYQNPFAHGALRTFFLIQCKDMKKSEKNRVEKVKKLLYQQKIRDLRQIEDYKLSVCHPHSAGIDIGSREIYVAINPETAAGLDEPVVRSFGTYTSALRECLDWLSFCGVEDVSMESTSVYWKNLYDILEEGGMKVCLVNPRKFRMVPGRKTDVLDCQWLQTLHMYGLLSGSFIPQGEVRKLRSLMRERDKTLKDRTRYIQRMQKAMVEMNLMLVNVVKDITGKTGMAIIKAILDGERSPSALAALRDGRCRRDAVEIALALEGDYKDDQLLLLRKNLRAYEFFCGQLDELDQEIEKLLLAFPSAKTEVAMLPPEPEAQAPAPDTPVELQPERKRGRPRKRQEDKTKPGKNDLNTACDLAKELLRINGTDLTAITGLGANTILQIMAEVGTDMSKFHSAKHFAAYLGFVPRNKITGGNIKSSKTDRIKSHAAQAFKKVVPSLSQGDSYLAAFYRRLVPRIGTGKAIVAVCRKLSIIYYNALTLGTEFVEKGAEYYRKQQEERERKYLQKLAARYNYSLSPAAVAQ